MGISGESKAFAARLNALLDLNNFPPKNKGRQTQLARLCSTSQKGARKWLESEGIPRIENIRSIAQEFKVNMAWLHYGDGAISDYHSMFGQQIQKARVQLGWTESELAVALNNAADNTTSIQAAGIKAIESGIRMEIIPSPADYAVTLGLSENTFKYWDKSNTTPSLSRLNDIKNGNTVVIPRLSAKASKCKGIPAALDHDTLISHVTVNKHWINVNLSTLSSPSNLAMIASHGDSMSGTFEHGDVLFVDTGINDIIMDSVYALNLNDELYIKRLQRRPDGSMMMLSDNAKYPPYVITEHDELQVLGRIVGVWNFKRL